MRLLPLRITHPAAFSEAASLLCRPSAPYPGLASPQGISILFDDQPPSWPALGVRLLAFARLGGGLVCLAPRSRHYELHTRHGGRVRTHVQVYTAVTRAKDPSCRERATTLRRNQVASTVWSLAPRYEASFGAGWAPVEKHLGFLLVPGHAKDLTAETQLEAVTVPRGSHARGPVSTTECTSLPLRPHPACICPPPPPPRPHPH